MSDTNISKRAVKMLKMTRELNDLAHQLSMNTWKNCFDNRRIIIREIVEEIIELSKK